MEPEVEQALKEMKRRARLFRGLPLPHESTCSQIFGEIGLFSP